MASRMPVPVTRHLWVSNGVARFRLPPRREENSIAIELNKLEPQGSQCRAYFVINNKSSADYEALKLDLVLFKPDGVIGRRFAVDLAPLKANKRAVKLFDLEGIACDEVGSFLINDVMECKAESGPARRLPAEHHHIHSHQRATDEVKGFDPVEQKIAIAAAPDYSVWGLVMQADPVVKGVMIILVLASVASWAIIFEKIVNVWLAQPLHSSLRDGDRQPFAARPGARGVAGGRTRSRYRPR